MPAHKVPTRLSTIAEEMRRQVSEIRAVRIGEKPAFVPPKLEDWRAIKYAAGDVAGGANLYVAGPGNSSAASFKRCAGWRHKGYEGQGAHELPATRDYFHGSNYRADGLDHRCKRCHSDYRHYVSVLDAQILAERKAKAAT
jgi:hypothetical protein